MMIALLRTSPDSALKFFNSNPESKQITPDQMAQMKAMPTQDDVFGPGSWDIIKTT